jgi:four helix bundle protein
MTFDHERLDVYRAAITFLGVASEVTGRLRGHAYLKDQLGRAARSMVTNIAEGSGESMPADKARFSRMAARRATECAGILDACRKLGVGEPAALGEGCGILLRVVGMLTGLAKRHQKTSGSCGRGDRQERDETYVAAHARTEHETELDALPDVAGGDRAGRPPDS